MLEPHRQIAELEAALGIKEARIAELVALVAERDAQLEEHQQQICGLQKKVGLLEELLGQNSGNSNRPPSSDPPGSGPKRGKGERGKGERGKRGKGKKNKRKRGGQPGHPGSHRKLLPPEQVDEVVDLYPEQCRNCWVSLPQILDPKATRHQVTEIPPLSPHTTEYRVHSVQCQECGHTSKMPLGESPIPASPFGPRLMSLVALLTGVYHVSRRKTAQLLSEVVGVRLSLGAVSAIEARVSEAVEPAVAQAWERVETAPVKHTDGTSWLRAGAVMALWTIATEAATVFKIIANATRASLEGLFDSRDGILVSDRATALTFWAMERRQICWAHLLRKFVSFSQRDGPAGAIGRDLLNYTGILFEYWHEYQAGRLDQTTFLTWMRPLRVQVEALLGRAVAENLRGVSGSCADILAHKDALWTFVHHDAVDPTNNHAERELRAFVLWRKRSFGTQSERGNLFAERIMTVAHTARKQNKDVLPFLTACCAARRAGTVAPLLFQTEHRAAC